MSHTTLVEALDALHREPRSVTYVESGDVERRVGFNELRRRALGVLRYLRRRGLKQGDQLILVLHANEQFIDAFWACLYGGIVAVPIAPGVSDEQRGKLSRVYACLDSPYLYTSQAQWERIAAFAGKSMATPALQELRARTLLAEDIDTVDEPAEPVAPGAEDIAFIQFSSGSTSEPKGIVLSHANLMANIQDIRGAADFSRDDISLSWMPLTHDMGLIGFHLNMLVAGMDHALMATEAFIRRPLLWLQTASRLKASVLCSPNFGYRHFLKAFRADKLEGVDLSCVRLVFNGAEPISPSLCDEFLDTLAPYGLEREAMFPVYGLAEASLAVSFPPLGRELRSRQLDRNRLAIGDMVEETETHGLVCVSVGRAIGACEVRIASAGGETLAAGRVGRILIRGPNVSRSFYRDAHLEPSAIDADGWVDTGDLGFVTDNELYITGRTKDVIFVNGQNYYAHDLENVAVGAADLDLGKIVVSAVRNAGAEEDEIVAFVQHRGDLKRFAPIAGAVARQINERTGAPVARVVPVPRIPKTTSGKVQRFALAEAYIDGEFDDSLKVLAALGPTSAGAGDREGSAIEQTLQEICDRVLGPGMLGREDNFFDIGTNSLKLIEIHELIEERFPGKLEVTDLFDYPNLIELSTFLEGQA